MPSPSSGLRALLAKAIGRLREKKILKGLRIGYKTLWSLLLILLAGATVVVFFVGGVAAGYFASLVKDQPILSREQMKKSIQNYAETSTIYFADGKELGRLKTDLIRTEVDVDDVAPVFIDALLATEDQWFYEHHGVVPKAVMRAMYQELTNQPVVTGGSTLTQQLVKNQILTNEVSFKRKAQEILYALRLEHFFDKKTILNAYINLVPFGRNASGQNIAGVQAAARGIFGVDAKDLNLPQAAFLAGLPQNPFVYSPYKNEGGLKDDVSAGIRRAHLVLRRMLECGAINKAEYQKALAYDYRRHFLKKLERPAEDYPYLMTEVHERAKQILAKLDAEKQGYDGERLAADATRLSNLEYVNRLLQNQGHPVSIEATVKKAGYDYQTLKKHRDLFNAFLENAEKQLEQNGYKIYTTIDKNVYDRMQKAADSYTGYDRDRVYTRINPQTGKKEEIRLPMEVGAMLIENDTGKIISFVGGRKDKYALSQVNHATQTRRQNGSSMKPLLDYGPAIENGIIQPGTILADLPSRYPGNYEPHNYGTTDNNGRFHGLETARTALYASHNVPAIQVYWMNRQKFNPLSYLEKMGFSSLVYPDNGPLPVGIGGLTIGVTVEENTNAYATFANSGTFVDAYMIEKITANDGKVVYQHKKSETKVFSPQTSYLVIDMLRDVLYHAGGTAADIPSRLTFKSDWFGKTGTSQDWHDSWFIAANPNVTLGIWTGYDQQAITVNGQTYSLKLNPATYHQQTAGLWAAFANAAYAADPKVAAAGKRFNMPAGIVKRTFCGLTNGPATEECKKAGLVVTDLFNEKFLPHGEAAAFNSDRYVVLNGRKVRALPSTPPEFTQTGLVLNRDFIQTHFPYVNLSAVQKTPGLDGFAAVDAYKPDNAAPAGIRRLMVNGKSLKWSKSPSQDVIGYRVYWAPMESSPFQKIADVVGGDQSSFTLGDLYGFYRVTAIDITGKESEPSPAASYGAKADMKTQTDEAKSETQ